MTFYALKNDSNEYFCFGRWIWSEIDPVDLKNKLYWFHQLDEDCLTISLQLAECIQEKTKGIIEKYDIRRI